MYARVKPRCSRFHTVSQVGRGFVARSATQTPAASSAAAQVATDGEIPQSQEDAIAQAVGALQTAFSSGKRSAPSRKRKKGKQAKAQAQAPRLWSGVKRLALELPVADQSPAAQYKLASTLVATFPSAAGLPTVLFGSQAVADLARDSDAPYTVFSVAEAAAPAPDGEDNELNGPLLIFETAQSDATACKHVVDELWSGRALVVANAEWLRDAPPAGMATFAESLDAVFYFLPVAFGGFLGGGQQGVLFKWAGSELPTKWQFFLDDKGTTKRVGLMDRKPSNEDMETMVYNSGAAKSPLAKGAKMFNSLTKGLRGGDKKG